MSIEGSRVDAGNWTNPNILRTEMKRLEAIQRPFSTSWTTTVGDDYVVGYAATVAVALVREAGKNRVEIIAGKKDAILTTGTGLKRIPHEKIGAAFTHTRVSVGAAARVFIGDSHLLTCRREESADSRNVELTLSSTEPIEPTTPLPGQLYTAEVKQIMKAMKASVPAESEHSG